MLIRMTEIDVGDECTNCNHLGVDDNDRHHHVEDCGFFWWECWWWWGRCWCIWWSPCCGRWLSNTDFDYVVMRKMLIVVMMMMMLRPVASSWVSPANYSPPNLLRRVKHTLTWFPTQSRWKWKGIQIMMIFHNSSRSVVPLAIFNTTTVIKVMMMWAVMITMMMNTDGVSLSYRCQYCLKESKSCYKLKISPPSLSLYCSSLVFLNCIFWCAISSRNRISVI